MRNERWCEPNQIKASLTSGYIKTKGGGPLLYQVTIIIIIRTNPMEYLLD